MANDSARSKQDLATEFTEGSGESGETEGKTRELRY